MFEGQFDLEHRFLRHFLLREVWAALKWQARLVSSGVNLI